MPSVATIPRLLSLLPIIACLVVSDALARAALPPEAQEAFDKGVAASDKGQYLDAIADFKTAREQAQTKSIFDAPEVYQKLGETEAKVPGRELRAICWLAAYLSVNPKAADADSVKAQITSLKQTSRDQLWRLMQMTEDTGKKVAAQEDARGLKQTSLDTVVYLWAECGGYPEAKKVAGTVVDALTRSRAYNRVTYAQIEAGDFRGVWATIADQEKAAAAIDVPDWDYYWRGEARLDLVLDEARMAEEQLKAGDHDGARASIAKAQQTAKLLVPSGMDNEQVSRAK